MKFQYTENYYLNANESIAYPMYSTKGAAAIDIRMCHPSLTLQPGESKVVSSGLMLEIPSNLAGIVIPRSGLGSKGTILGNSIGLIDSDYRGEIFITLWNRTDSPIHHEVFTRIVQMLFIPVVTQLFELGDLTPTERANGGFGHTGVK